LITRNLGLPNELVLLICSIVNRKFIQELLAHYNG
jgi:hypothetical protein